jgi:Na+-transporting NADH:ubiquinone oxidoreductase subunit B
MNGTTSPPYLRSTERIRQVIDTYVVATLPTALLGIWNLGAQMLAHTVHSNADQPGLALLRALGLPASADNALASLLVGLACALPRIVTALLTAAAWDVLAARLRHRTIDPAWLPCGWLLALLLPAGASLPLVVLATSFAMLFGSVVFGGTGRYLLSPALLGAVFLRISYPDVAQLTLPLHGVVPSTWRVLAEIGWGPQQSYWPLFLGAEVGSIGATSALGCLLGALYLVHRGIASPGCLLGAIVGLLGITALLQTVGPQSAAAQLPWYVHLAVGQFAFALVFLASDPSAAALTGAARWAQGVTIGATTVLIRALDPTHPDGALYAVLLAGLAVPLFDYLAVRFAIARRAERSET